jgi:hypothetical protein
MGIFFGEQIYGIRYSDLSGDDYVTVYERAPDIGFPIDKASIRKILLDESRMPCSTERVFYIYTYYITTYSDDSMTQNNYMWRNVTREQLLEAGKRI